jgi:hypothetical protein
MIKQCVLFGRCQVQRQCACAEGNCAQHSVLQPDGVTNLHSDPPAPIHMVVGTGGASFTKNAYGAPFNERTQYVWGYARVTAHNGSYLTWEFVDSARGLSGGTSGVVVDRMAIRQDPQAIADSIRERNPYPDAPAPAPAPSLPPTHKDLATPSPSLQGSSGGGGGGGGGGGKSGLSTGAAVGIVCGACVLGLVMVVGRLAMFGRLFPARAPPASSDYMSMDKKGDGGDGGKSALLLAFDAAYETTEESKHGHDDRGGELKPRTDALAMTDI